MCNNELWNGFYGSIIGAGIGVVSSGVIAYFIAKYKFNRQEKTFRTEKEIQLLWKIFIDIKNDSEKAKLWDKYGQLLEKRRNHVDAQTEESILNTLEFIMKDLRDFFDLLSRKEIHSNTEKLAELNVLWERAYQHKTFMNKIFDELTFVPQDKKNSILNTYFKDSDEFYRIHKNYTGSTEIKLFSFI